jgi:hypothetical protein
LDVERPNFLEIWSKIRGRFVIDIFSELLFKANYFKKANGANRI